MKTILVIEDDALIRINILKILSFKGFQAIGAETGEEGIQLAQAHRPDLILCDVLMPGLDGFDVLKTLRRDPDTGTTPFIFLSARTDRRDIRQGMNLGADDYLTKPFTTAELLETIAARLHKQETVVQPYLDEMKQAAICLSRGAYSDPLTDLPNRIVLQRQLQDSIRRAKQERSRVGVVWLNLTSFRTINASLGYACGDTLLQAVAERLLSSVGGHDLVARLGGDEFGLILSEILPDDAIESRLQPILNRLNEPYEIGPQTILQQVSVGVALYPDHGSAPEPLLGYAETAQRWGRKHGNGCLQQYSPAMGQLDSERQAMKAELLQALEHSEFRLLYQPQFNLITGRIMGVEALLRWQHPQQGLVNADAFIAIAQETKLIIPIGEWVLRTACLQAQAWQSLNGGRLRLSVNLSDSQLRGYAIVQTLHRVLHETQFDPHLLTLELTETCLIRDADEMISVLHAIKDQGIEIAIDDFGTGYSSLSYLHRFPIDCLKIDRAFIHQIATDSPDSEVAKAIIAVAQSLRLKVIAEGVESQEQAEFLREHGCYAIQGYLCSPPLPDQDFQQLLESDQRFITRRPQPS